MGGGFLIVAFTYNLQKRSEGYIDKARSSVSEAKEMENELIAIKGITHTYIFTKSDVWLDSLRKRQQKFIYHLERARFTSNSHEERQLIQQISALFSNFEQNIFQAVAYYKRSETSSANALLIHSAQNLLETIQQKSNDFIVLNQQVEIKHEIDIKTTNSLIIKLLITLGIVGIVGGLLLGWLISKMLFYPINQLILKVRGASGEAVFEKIKFYHGGDLDELAERIKELIDRVNKAHFDLSKNKELLQHSNKFANLGKIAPTIAHEIRNPLAAIKMLVYSVREEGDLPPSVIDDLNIISNEIDRMERFTRDFLKFAKPAEPILAKINPNECLEEVLRLLKPNLKKNGIDLIYHSLMQPITILADSSQIKQIFLNVTLNAIEVMSDGGELRIKSEIVKTTNPFDNKNELKNYFSIVFSDSGPGIPDAIMNKLFEPFIKGNEQGVGIGLSISQGIANSHGGWINAENNRPNRGATFSLFLPLSQ